MSENVNEVRTCTRGNSTKSPKLRASMCEFSGCIASGTQTLLPLKPQTSKPLNAKPDSESYCRTCGEVGAQWQAEVSALLTLGATMGSINLGVRL